MMPAIVYYVQAAPEVSTHAEQPYNSVKDSGIISRFNENIKKVEKCIENQNSTIKQSELNVQQCKEGIAKCQDVIEKRKASIHDKEKIIYELSKKTFKSMDDINTIKKYKKEIEILKKNIAQNIIYIEKLNIARSQSEEVIKKCYHTIECLKLTITDLQSMVSSYEQS